MANLWGDELSVVESVFTLIKIKQGIIGVVISIFTYLAGFFDLLGVLRIRFEFGVYAAYRTKNIAALTGLDVVQKCFIDDSTLKLF